MKNRTLTRLCTITLVLVLAVVLTACGNVSASGTQTTAQAIQQNAASTQAQETTKAKAEPVTIRFMSDLPDRTSGQGLLEQKIIDQYQQENPNVKIDLETLQDVPYQQKFKAYTASNSIPDLYMVWGFPSFFGPVMKAGLAAELNKSDYDSYNFFPGSLDGFSNDGKLYGLPRNTDYMFLYYNKKLFDDNGIKVPTTFEELLDATKAFRAKGITPCAMDGKDRWPIAMLIQDLQLMASGDQKAVYNALAGKTSFAKDAGLLKGAQLFKQLMDAKFFQDSFTAADYGAANNLFAQGKAAMYYMGEWETGMATNANFPDSFKENVHAMAFPALKDGPAKSTDLVEWNGGGYAVSAQSKVKSQAISLLNYIFKPDNWAKQSWQLGVNVPAQKFDSYFTGKETGLQKEVVGILNAATSASGTDLIDASTAAFKEDSQNLAQSFAAGSLTPEQYLEGMDKAAKKDNASGN